ncbi:class I SAM-dependent methyltransferase [Henriciella litoralis]|uniref:class I SAM-dependent methyltransferase n=1 Tax=Henriciella litoralis TaxID=568102 RepID=UPI00146CA334|nr:class I SAM-dependent methyltransferase [Henriciella litoralis]
MKQHLIFASAALALAGCATGNQMAGRAPADVIPPPSMVSELDTAAATNAIDNPNRPETDTERDDLRRPMDVLAFMGIPTGVSILEMEAGGGYFTEIFSRYVGEDGKVYMQNPASFDAFLGNALEQRLDGLDNVEYVKANFDELPLEDASMDVATWFQGPHELWYSPEGSDALVTNPDDSFPEIFRVLKPGARFVVIDHSAPEGSPATVGGETHRIDPQIIRDLGMEAGFILVAESDLFDNPDDDLSANIFEEAVRGRTDQVMMMFEKPATAPAP